MSNMTIEVVEELPGLSDSVPCQLYNRYLGRLCKRPSVARVRLACACGDTEFIFLCQAHFEELARGNVRHSDCPDTPSTWTSA